MIVKIIRKLCQEISLRLLEPLALALANLFTISYPLPLASLKGAILKIIGIRLSSPVFIDKGFKCLYPRNIFISENCSLGHYNKIWAFNKVVIGPYVQTAMGVTIISGGHRTDNFAPLEENQEIVIEGGNWIGANVTILGGAKIGRGAIIAAGAVVTGTIPPFTIAGGVPARVLKERDASNLTLSPFGLYQTQSF